MSASIEHPDRTPGEEPLRPVPRKLSLRVSGARPGTATRPDGPALDRGPDVLTNRRAALVGLRVHSSSFVPRSAAPSGPLDPADYATADDYEDKR